MVVLHPLPRCNTIYPRIDPEAVAVDNFKPAGASGPLIGVISPVDQSSILLFAFHGAVVTHGARGLVDTGKEVPAFSACFTRLIGSSLPLVFPHPEVRHLPC